LTVLAPLKLVPVIVTAAPVMSDVGAKELIVGATCAVTVNDPEVVTVPTGLVGFVTLICPALAAWGQLNCSAVADLFKTVA
jgi:hypothetical protein